MPITVEKIQERVNASGYKKNFLSEQLGISRVSFKNKLEGKTEFTLAELNKLNALVKIFE